MERLLRQGQRQQLGEIKKQVANGDLYADVDDLFGTLFEPKEGCWPFA